MQRNQSSFTTKLTQTCLLGCPGCSLASQLASVKPATSRPNNQHRSIARWYYAQQHILAPLLPPTIAAMIAIQPLPRWHLWTTGIGFRYWDDILTYLDHITLFVPGYNIAGYHTVTGYNGWDELGQCIALLSPRSFSISTVIRPDTIGDLPDFYDWAMQQPLHRFIVYYNPRDSWHAPDAVAYIKRFNRMNRCRTCPQTPSDKTRCWGVPHTRIDWIRWLWAYWV